MRSDKGSGCARAPVGSAREQRTHVADRFDNLGVKEVERVAGPPALVALAKVGGVDVAEDGGHREGNRLRVRRQLVVERDVFDVDVALDRVLSPPVPRQSSQSQYERRGGQVKGVARCKGSGGGTERRSPRRGGAD